MTRTRQITALVRLIAVLYVVEWQGDHIGVNAVTCISCATPILRYQWQTTGFPFESMNNVTFDDTCASPPENSFVVECPSEVCFELFKIIGGQVAIMRGCHQEMLGSLKSDFAMTKERECMYGTSSSKINKENAVEGVQFCKKDNCNNVVTRQHYKVDKWPSDTCVKTDSQTCISCYRYGGDGDCYYYFRDTCQGAWCTKTVGYLDGKWIEVRGCAAVNALHNTLCTRIEQESMLGLPSEIPISQTYITNQCYCRGDKCNGAATVAVNMGGLFLLLAAAIFTS